MRALWGDTMTGLYLVLSYLALLVMLWLILPVHL